MSKMPPPTPKKVRKLYGRVRYHMWQLQKALNDAHWANVIVYTDETRDGPESVCGAFDIVKERFEKATEKARANALKEEVMNKLKGVW